MTRRSCVLAAFSIVLAFMTAIGADGGFLGASSPRTLAAPLSAPLAAPDNSIALQPFLSGFTFPVFMTHAGDGANRLYVVEKAGLIKLVVDGVVRPTPFLDLVEEVADAGEQGLLGLAFHPQYETNRRFFIYYTAAGSPTGVGNNVLAEYHRHPTNPEIAVKNEVHTFLSIPDFATNHNGGTIAFGQDGKLYLATGDGGGTPQLAQDLTSLFGKVLRIDIDAAQTPATTPDPPGADYALPTDNPFFGQGGGVREEIWALGLRNPYRWSFDRQTGDMLVADVGAGTWEEVSFLRKGVGALNLGWVIREGAHCTPPATSCQTNGLTDPILEYSHGLGCAITGGYRYRGSQNPALQGIYFYGDFCTGRIWKGIASGHFWGAIEALDTAHQISSFGEDESGELYVVTSAGEILRLRQAASPPPANCTQRPRIAVQSTRVGPGTLIVNLTATDSSTVANNELHSVAFNNIVNAFVTIGSQVDQTGDFTVGFAPGTKTAQFTARRDKPGQRMQVDFGITDRCGLWQTFVGGGPNMP
jgi:glucose/arabinose dehydrogenase